MLKELSKGECELAHSREHSRFCEDGNERSGSIKDVEFLE
jgi:hypothetical protein